MTIDPLFRRAAETEFTSQGAYGDFLNQMRPATKRPERAPEQVFSPYLETQTGVEIVTPGETADSIATRQKQAADEEAKRKAAVAASGTTAGTAGKTVVNTFTNAQGQQIAVFSDGTTAVIGQGKDVISERKSAFDLLRQEFERYGLGSLVGDTLALAQEGVSPAEFSLRLRQTEPYKKRFAANATRIKSGLSALSEAQYVALEDQYQNIMRQYGLPKSMYATGDMGIQSGLEQFIAGDVSPAELESRVNLAVTRVQNASPDVLSTLATYYPNITKDNLVAYVLDPQKALPEIQRQVQSAEIGGTAGRFGLAASRARAEELARAGVTQAQAEQGYQTIAEILPRGSQLAEVYKQSPYTQATAEQEAFGLTGAAEAAKQRKKLTQLEQASFSGQSGMGALARDRAGSF